MKTISVLVVDDSAFMRRMISDMIEQDADLQVIATARNGEDALAKYQSLEPDVVTLDIELPDINGLELLSKLLEVRKKPVIMLSTLTQKGAEITFEAMNRGAVEFISKPSGAISLDISKIQEELVKKIKLSVDAKIALPDPKPISPDGESHVEKKDFSGLWTKDLKAALPPLLIIGSSTGGPRALQEVIPNIPRDFPGPVLVVQHMPPKFTKSLADRLNRLSSLDVKEAESGDRLQKGRVYLAPGGFHMKIEPLPNNLSIVLTEEPAVHGVRPSIDVLLNSAVKVSGYQLIAVILTGMGKDGTDGLSALKKAQDVYTIAESEKTAIVYGMPRAVVNAGLADQVCCLEEIPAEICRQLYEKRS